MKCKCISPLLESKHGEYMYLLESDARSMQLDGYVEPCEPLVKTNDAEKYSAYLSRKAFRNDGSMKVAWVQDYLKPNGGAEVTNYFAVHIGECLGHDVVGYCNSSHIRRILESADIVVINNLRTNQPMRKEVFELVVNSGKPYVRFDHDYYEDDPAIHRNAALNAFLSPAHLAHYVKICGEQIKEKSICLPLAIDTSIYRLMPNIKRVQNSVFFPSFEKCSGNAERYMHENRGKRFVIGDHYGYGEMPRLYNECEIVYHCPRKPGAGERVLFEAILCGCKVVCDEKSGHTSWGFDWRNRAILKERCDAAPFEFWKRVEGLAK